MNRLAVLTSGGDAPGMNAALRSVVRTAISKGIGVFGVMRGYQGLIDGEIVPMNARSVSNIIQRGGTILKTSRCKEFEAREGQLKAKANLETLQIDALVVIGGNGTLRGAMEFSEIWPGQIVGLPGTIDNDLAGTDFTIGYDTAVNTGLYAIDRLRDTADAHERVFVIEVMGRHAGFIAVDVAVAGGAEEVLVPEIPEKTEELAARLAAGRKKGKTSSIVLVAEGVEGGADRLAKVLKDRYDIESRVMILGHLQRGGSPTSADRVLATELGAWGVELLTQGQKGVLAGKVHGGLTAVPFSEAIAGKKPLNDFLMGIMPALAS